MTQQSNLLGTRADRTAWVSGDRGKGQQDTPLPTQPSRGRCGEGSQGWVRAAFCNGGEVDGPA